MLPSRVNSQFFTIDLKLNLFFLLKDQLQLAESIEETSMDTRETNVPITNKHFKEDEVRPVATIEEAVSPVTEIFHEGSILPLEPLIHDEATQETEFVIDQESHNATPTAAEVPQVKINDQLHRSNRIRARQIQSFAKPSTLSDDPVNQENQKIISNLTEPRTFREAINCAEA